MKIHNTQTGEVLEGFEYPFDYDFEDSPPCPVCGADGENACCLPDGEELALFVHQERVEGW